MPRAGYTHHGSNTHSRRAPPLFIPWWDVKRVFTLDELTRRARHGSVSAILSRRSDLTMFPRTDELQWMKQCSATQGCDARRNGMGGFRISFGFSGTAEDFGFKITDVTLRPRKSPRTRYRFGWRHVFGLSWIDLSYGCFEFEWTIFSASCSSMKWEPNPFYEFVVFMCVLSNWFCAFCAFTHGCNSMDVRVHGFECAIHR
jgi:hypothetical protein